MCAGLSYCFSIYSSSLKDQFGLSQTQLEQLGFAVNLGGYLSIFAGSVYNTYSDSHKLGPRYAMATIPSLLYSAVFAVPVPCNQPCAYPPLAPCTVLSTRSRPCHPQHVCAGQNTEM